MIVFVETNFVLELALEQGEVREAKTILDLAEARKIELKIPAFSLIEPRYKLLGAKAEQRTLRDSLSKQLDQIVRSAGFADLRDRSNDLLRTLASKADSDVGRFSGVVGRILMCAEILPMTKEVLVNARVRPLLDLDLEPPDAVVFASVIARLETLATKSIFATKDAKGFMNKPIVDELNSKNCTVLPTFENALSYLQKHN